MTRHGTPIAEYPTKGGVNTGIRYSAAFEQWQAAAAAGLDLWKWDNGGYPVRFMEKIVAFYRGKQLVEIHQQDAANRAQQQASKGRRRGYRRR